MSYFPPDMTEGKEFMTYPAAQHYEDDKNTKPQLQRTWLNCQFLAVRSYLTLNKKKISKLNCFVL